MAKKIKQGSITFKSAVADIKKLIIKLAKEDEDLAGRISKHLIALLEKELRGAINPLSLERGMKAGHLAVKSRMASQGIQISQAAITIAVDIIGMIDNALTILANK